MDVLLLLELAMKISSSGKFGKPNLFPRVRLMLRRRGMDWVKLRIQSGFVDLMMIDL